ncbi:position-specific antigen beta subunit myospheroid isoform X2 [Arctopsyche grandis]|uniref:position-specific antigen beta subunit myospheroid isoform X2 n=1 Tax=Arctopsyche grandis TaxID=121162 RepID=UPI00406D7EF4
MTMYHVLVLTILSAIFALSSSQQVDKFQGLNPCTAKATCHECIQTSSCAWCFQADFGDKPRCFQPSMTSISGGCEEAYIFSPDNRLTKLENRELSKGSASGSGMMSSSGSMSGSMSGSGSMSSSGGSWGHSGSSASGEIVQISPQRVKLELRINEVYKMNVRYAQAEDYPVDLYYLMDLSKSMQDDKEKLSALGDLLSESMKNITSNFKLGFGSFVDKVVMPYVSTVPKNLAEPCSGCAAPYGYHNIMSLSTNTYRFAEEVRNAAVSGNLDAPEGGFDAIMQAVVCRNEIGWREKARRLLVFSTDAGFHYAGDGKLGGIVKPNDGVCHLDNNGWYTYSSYQDYPSISHVNLKVKENAINIIFAVTAEQIAVYERLGVHIEGASAGVLSADSSNVVELVKDQYSKISSSVEMKDNSTSAISIKYFSSCLKGGTSTLTSKCDGLKVGDTVEFTAEIMVTSCPKDPKEWHQVFQIYPVGINESLIVDLEMLCDCPCERPGNSGFEAKSPSCQGFGTLSCGICDCDKSHFGQKCECSVDQVNSSNDTKGCRPDSTTTLDCSGRGVCSCGRCSCQQEGVYGTYCQCDDFSCDRHNGLLCSGPDHGNCRCGVCECKHGWSGKACDCRSTEESCIPPGGGEVCAGHGKCVCGQCVCEVGDEGRYSGRYCDKCPTCTGRCAEFKECVQCQVYKTGPLVDNGCNNCTFTPTSIKVVEAHEEKDEHLCAYYDEDDCRFAFVYSYDENEKVLIRAQENRECPPTVFLPGIILGVIAAIVLIGLAFLLLWKMVTTIHDRREFARFEKERMMAKWDTGENPIYKQATSTFKNPTYAGK